VADDGIRTQQYWELKDATVAMEQRVLRAIAFDLQVVQPYHYVLNFIKSLRGWFVEMCASEYASERVSYSRAAGSQELAQVAWSIVTDSLYTKLWLLYQPRTSFDWRTSVESDERLNRAAAGAAEQMRLLLHVSTSQQPSYAR